MNAARSFRQEAPRLQAQPKRVEPIFEKPLVENENAPFSERLHAAMLRIQQDEKTRRKTHQETHPNAHDLTQIDRTLAEIDRKLQEADDEIRDEDLESLKKLNEMRKQHLIAGREQFQALRNRLEQANRQREAGNQTADELKAWPTIMRKIETSQGLSEAENVTLKKIANILSEKAEELILQNRRPLAEEYLALALEIKQPEEKFEQINIQERINALPQLIAEAGQKMKAAHKTFDTEAQERTAIAVTALKDELDELKLIQQRLHERKELNTKQKKRLEDLPIRGWQQIEGEKK